MLLIAPMSVGITHSRCTFWHDPARGILGFTKVSEKGEQWQTMMGRHAPTLSTLLSNQARGSSVDSMNPLLGPLRFKRRLRERASQIDDCHLWSRPGNAGTEFGLWFARTHSKNMYK